MPLDLVDTDSTVRCLAAVTAGAAAAATRLAVFTPMLVVFLFYQTENSPFYAPTPYDLMYYMVFIKKVCTTYK